MSLLHTFEWCATRETDKNSVHHHCPVLATQEKCTALLPLGNSSNCTVDFRTTQLLYLRPQFFHLCLGEEQHTQGDLPVCARHPFCCFRLDHHFQSES